MKDAIILIPSYEPDELLIKVVDELINDDFNILVVNDGSGKEFEPIFDQIKDKVKYLSFEKNKGKGAAMKYGYKELLNFYPEAKYVITVDGDGQHSLKDINRIYDKLVETDQLVFGVRSFGKDVPFRSKFGNYFSKTTRSLLTKQYIQDDQCGLRGFPIRYLPDLIKIKGNRYEYEMNQVVRIQLMQASLYTIPIETIYLDGNSRSHFSPFKDTFRIQTIIFLHAIPALLCNALLMFMMITLMKYSSFSIIETTYFSYTVCLFIYFLLINNIYPSQSFFRRLWKELLFTAIRMGTCHGLLEIFLTTLHCNYNVTIPLVVIFCASFNVLFAWLFRKMFPSF
ncbi:MAG: glycosyltransferase [Bacilli bacterium]|nr:glycosyltransferase [Bacilli bacterium]